MKLLKPCSDECVVSNRFNTPRSYPFAPNRKQLHEGLDFAPKVNAQDTYYVFAAEDGQIVKTGFDKEGYGNFVVIRHNSRFTTWYGHLNKILVKNNAQVLCGDVIGIMGSTGNSTGKHLHFNVQDQVLGLTNYVVSKVVDPYPLIVSEIGTCVIDKSLYDVIIDNITDIQNVSSDK